MVQKINLDDFVFKEFNSNEDRNRSLENYHNKVTRHYDGFRTSGSSGKNDLTYTMALIIEQNTGRNFGDDVMVSEGRGLSSMNVAECDNEFDLIRTASASLYKAVKLNNNFSPEYKKLVEDAKAAFRKAAKPYAKGAIEYLTKNTNGGKPLTESNEFTKYVEYQGAAEEIHGCIWAMEAVIADVEKESRPQLKNRIKSALSKVLN